MRRWTHAILERLGSLTDLERARFASPLAAETRRLTMPGRIERVRRLADAVGPALSDADRERITRLLVVLTSSSSLRMWHESLGRTADEVADDLDWVVRAVVDAAQSGSRR
jgi:hypothetical protein